MPSKLSENMQKLPFAKMIYPAITLIFIIAFLLLFSKTIFFLTTSINKVFSDDSASLKKEVTQFDMANYELIQKRFGWPDLATTSPAEIKTAPPATSTVQNTDTPQIAAEKAAIIIQIFSGSEKNENGNALQMSLNQAGFTNTKPASHQLILANTIIQFKSAPVAQQEYFNLIKEIISEKYTVQVGSELPDSADYDVSILIGKK